MKQPCAIKADFRTELSEDLTSAVTSGHVRTILPVALIAILSVICIIVVSVASRLLYTFTNDDLNKVRSNIATISAYLDA